jgi:Zn-dependent protease with chaperone function
MKTATFALALTLTAAPALAQFGRALGKLNKAADQAQKVKDLKFSDADERRIGEAVSVRILEEFGALQDKEVAKYVTLVGSVLAQASTRPDLSWEFIVLDTDGVNAFAAPGGIVHITRGALGLAKSEAELAGVLAHEITHITARHTVRSIQKSKVVGLTADTASTGGLTQDLIARVAERAYEAVLNNQFDRDDENEADRVGVALANQAGYAPNGLSTVLAKIADRNQGREEPNGMFASHPVLKDRIDRIGQIIGEQKLSASALVASRYGQAISFETKPISTLALVAEGARGLAGPADSTAPKKEDDSKKEEKEGAKGGLFGGRLKLSKGTESKSSQTVASAGARGGVPDRDAVGGPNKTKVPMTVSAQEIAEFKKGII